MRIAYLMHWNDGPASGVFKKVLGQLAAWKQLGHEPALFLFTRAGKDEFTGDTLPLADAGEVPLMVQSYSRGYRRMREFRKLSMRLKEWRPDVIYHRYDAYYSSLPGLLSRYPSVLEINTDDISELRLQRGRSARYYYQLLTRGRVLRAASGFVFVSGELAELAHFQRYAKNPLILGNGIDLGKIPPPSRNASEADGDPAPVRLVFLGSAGQPWHGMDELAALAKLQPDWKFDVVGISPNELAYVPPNMELHGRLSVEEYQPLLDRADIAVGTLALYRKDMQEASPLKVREYLANGLPVLIAYQDTDFAGSVPFLLQIPNEPGNIARSLREIEDFVETWRGRRVKREDVEHLDTRVKERIRIDYLRGLAKVGERG